MSRKTRAQKIQSNQRKAIMQTKTGLASPDQSKTSGPVTSVVDSHPTTPPTADVIPQSQVFSYVGRDLRHIAWTALICLILLTIATLFLSDFPWIQSARQALHLPTLTF